MVLITGGAGQLAKEFQRFFKKNNIDFLAPNRMELDITDFDKVRDYSATRFVMKSYDMLKVA